MNMKQARSIVIVCALISLSIYPKKQDTSALSKISLEKKEAKITSEQFTIKIESKWKDLERDRKKNIFKDKWIWAGDIIIKKTASEYVSLHELHLTWKGKKIDQLIASLYDKNNDKTFMPIEKYLICDSIWKKSEQRLILKFEKPKTLYSVNKLSLVLTLPQEMIHVLKNGHFTIDSEYLPRPYQEHAAEHNLCLCFNNLEIVN